MKKKKFLKILFSICILVFCFFLIDKFVFAEVNSEYAKNSIKFDDSESIIEKILGFITSLLLKLLGYAIFGVTWCIEKLVAGIVGMLTGMKTFPWADLTIFNALPLLDVNFINPAEHSLFRDTGTTFTAIGNTVRNIYFSGLSIALGFLGIVVAVMAIRLAISSIAADKARYKEAIVHWATAIVLVFGMHYVISFVFYLNEQVVEVASSMAQQVITDNSSSLSFLGDADNTSSITLMGEYFKNESIDLKNLFNVNTFTYAVLYAVFVFQSIMFFWSYFKRFFYVLILALISPFVVIYDFLTKSVS